MRVSRPIQESASDTEIEIGKLEIRLLPKTKLLFFTTVPWPRLESSNFIQSLAGECFPIDEVVAAWS